jgi:CubicO group peptidase (beta-lactamase class C family)
MWLRCVSFIAVVLVVSSSVAQELSAEAKAKALMTAEVRPAAYVFTGKDFPKFDFADPALGARLLGSYSVATTFYGANWKPAAGPAGPGRFGAVVEIKGADGVKITRFRTVYRAADGYDAKLQAYWGPSKALYFGGGVRVPRDAWQAWPASGPRFHVAVAEYHTQDGQDLAILAAGAADLAQDPWLADRQWWVKMKRALYKNKTELDVDFVCPTAYGHEHTPTLREGTAAEAGMQPGAAEKLDALLTQWAAESGEPFAVALARRGVVFLHKAYGERDGAPMTTDSPTWMASISKLMSSTLMWMLVDRGFVKLDAPIETYLPALRYSPREKPILVRDLYTHTNGLALDIVLPGHYPNHWGDEMHDLDEVIAGYYSYLQPAKEPTYNGVGFAIGGKIIELVTGEALPNFYRHHLLDPLGMAHTYTIDGSAATRSIPMDMAKLGQMILNKGAYGDMRFFSEETFAKMLPKPLTESLASCPSPSCPASSAPARPPSSATSCATARACGSR